MNICLQVHYDDVHVELYRKKRGDGSSNFRLNQKVVNAYASGRHEQLHLPKSVKEILQKPADEEDWMKLDRLRFAIICEMESVQEIHIEDDTTIAKIAAAVEDNEKDGHEGVVGENVGDPYDENITMIPAGARVEAAISSKRPRSKVARRKEYAGAIRRLCRPEINRRIRVKMRPLGSKLAMDLDDFGQEMAAGTPAAALAAKFCSEAASTQEVLDRMLLVLYDALWLSACERWTARGVANLDHERTFLMAQGFLRGQAVGKRPLHDGMCACCGALLHGVQNDHSALSNKCNGPPIDVRGQEKLTTEGAEDTEAQPPFLLSYSPALFAREIPAIFEYDPDMNCLSLKEGVQKPWVRPKHGRQKEGKRTWLYCCECRDRYCPAKGSRQHGHVPYRDQSSQKKMKPEYKRERCNKVMPDTEAPDLGEQDVQEVGAMDPKDMEDAVDALATLAAATELQPEAQEHEHAPAASEIAALQTSVAWTPFPTLDEYRSKWEVERAKHVKVVPGEFGPSNLIPEPKPELMQDVPWVPFHLLKTEDAQARLSVCRPISGLQEAQLVAGVPTYAHNTGEVKFCRRNPLQVAATFACVLNKHDGQFMGLSAEELAAWHECITWLREPGHNNVLRLYGTQYERLVASCNTIAEALRSRGVLFEGHARAKIRWTPRFGHDVDEGMLGEMCEENGKSKDAICKQCVLISHDCTTYFLKLAT